MIILNTFVGWRRPKLSACASSCVYFIFVHAFVFLNSSEVDACSMIHRSYHSE